MSPRQLVKVSLSRHKTKNYTYWYLRWFSSDGRQRGQCIGRVDGPNKLSRRQAEVKRARKEQEIYENPGRRDISQAPRLSQFLANYLISRKNELGPGTIELHQQTQKYLLAYYKTDPTIDEITKHAARDFKTALASGKLKNINKHPKDLKPATVDIHIRNCRTIFAQALEDEIILNNPFAKLCRTIKTRKDWYYVGLDEFEKLLKSCPNQSWRLLLALCRLAGLRQSEALELLWRDVDWDKSCLSIWSKKTQQSRIVPIVPELYPLLSNAWQSLPEGCKGQIVAGLRKENLWRDFQVIRKRANIRPYNKWCHTLRKNREQDWAENFPGHVVASWMGHGPGVAQAHYLKVDDRNILAATKTPIKTELAQPIAQQDLKKRVDNKEKNCIDLLQKKI
jgi:integrase